MGFESGLISDSEDEVELIGRDRGSVARAPLQAQIPGVETGNAVDFVEAGPELEMAREVEPELVTEPIIDIEPEDDVKSQTGSLSIPAPQSVQALPPASVAEPGLQSHEEITEHPRIEPQQDPEILFGNLFLSSQPQIPEPLKEPALSPTSTNVPRTLRKRKTNQMRPYTYDKRKYGNLVSSQDYNAQPSSSQPPSSQYQNSQFLSSPFRGSQEASLESNQWSEREAWDQESQERQPRSPWSPTSPSSPQSPPQPQAPPVSFSVNSDSSDFSDSSDSDSELITSSRVIVDLTKESHQLTDFMRVAVNSFKRNGERRVPTKKYIRHEKSSNLRKAQKRRRQQAQQPARPRKQMRLSYTSKNGTEKEKLDGAGQHPLFKTRVEATNGGDKNRTPARAPARAGVSAQTQKRKRTRDAAAKLLNVTSTSLRSRHKPTDPPPKPSIYYAPIIQEEDGSYYIPRRVQNTSTRNKPAEERLENQRGSRLGPQPYPDPSSRQEPQPFIFSMLPTGPKRFTLSTFAGSNTLTLLTSPEPWTGVNNHRPILESCTRQTLRDAFELYGAYMTDDSIESETFETIYTYFFQMGSELLRPDTLLEDGVREYILALCCSTLEKINSQMEASSHVVQARFVFCLFALCAGYSSGESPCGSPNQYNRIAELVMCFVVNNMAAIATSVKAMGSVLGREAVVIELLVVMFKLDVWHHQLLKFKGNLETHWQLIFVDAFLKDVLQVNTGGWQYVLPLLSQEKNLHTSMEPCLERSLALLRVWRWPPNKQVPAPFFEFIARVRKYADPELQALDIPDFVIRGQFKAQSHETAFSSFLDLLGYTFKHLPDGPDRAILRHRVTPMTVVSWQNPTPEMLSGLAQRHAILLVIVRTSDSSSVEQILNVPQDAHIALKMKALTTWSLLVQIVDDPKCADWLSQLVLGCVRTLAGAGSQGQLYNQLQRFFCELHKILLKNPHASRYYSGHEVKPLDYNPSPALLALTWKSIQQMPIKALAAALPSLESYFSLHREPMHVYVQALSRLGTSNLAWPHDNSQEFVCAMLENFKVIPFENVAEHVFKCLAKPIWNSHDLKFLDVVRKVFNVQAGTDRIELIRALAQSEQNASVLLGCIKSSSQTLTSLDNLEKMSWSRTVSSIRTICFNRFPQLERQHRWLVPASEKSKNTVRDYISNQQVTTLEYFLSHRIRLALQSQRNLVDELVNCIALEDKTSQAFDLIVNKVFSFYVWSGLKKPRMHKVIPALVEATINVLNYSDSLEYDPSPFVQSLVQYAQVYISGSPPFDWTPIAQFCKLCCHCVRQLWVKGYANSEWDLTLEQIEELLSDIEAAQGGLPSSPVAHIRSYTGEEGAIDDFLRLDVPSWGSEMALKERIRCLRDGLRGLRGGDLLL